MSELDDIKSILRGVAERTEALAERQNRFQDQLELSNRETRQLIADSNQELRQLIHSSAEDTVSMIGSLGEEIQQLKEQMQLQAEEAQRDRNQAAIDRASFQSTVTQILEVLRQQFTTNGNN